MKRVDWLVVIIVGHKRKKLRSAAPYFWKRKKGYWTRTIKCLRDDNKRLAATFISNETVERIRLLFCLSTSHPITVFVSVFIVVSKREEKKKTTKGFSRFIPSTPPFSSKFISYRFPIVSIAVLQPINTSSPTCFFSLLSFPILPNVPDNPRKRSITAYKQNKTAGG